jgi:cell division protein FtsB
LRIKNSIRRVVFLIAFALVGAFGYITLRSPQGLPALRQKWSEIRQLEEQNAALQRENEYRGARIKKLQQNPSEQELEIRKKLKLLRPGETSFILPEQTNHAEPSHSDTPRDDSTVPRQPPAQD